MAGRKRNSPAGGKLTGAARGETVRVRKAGKRRSSSTRWLERQLNDPYVAEARRLGYRSRAAFKLLQLDERFGLLKPGRRVVDLGAAPGGWTQVAVARVGGRGGGQGKVVGADLQAMDAIPGAILLQLDCQTADAVEIIKGTLGGPADVVLSDMAPAATGHGQTDHIRIMALADAAYATAADLLAPGGAFVAKVLQGGAERELLTALKRDFASVRHVKPAASRSDSSEVYIVALGFRRATSA